MRTLLALAILVGSFWGSAAIHYKLISVGGSDFCYRYLQIPLPTIPND